MFFNAVFCRWRCVCGLITLIPVDSWQSFSRQSLHCFACNRSSLRRIRRHALLLNIFVCVLLHSSFRGKLHFVVAFIVQFFRTEPIRNCGMTPTVRSCSTCGVVERLPKPRALWDFLTRETCLQERADLRRGERGLGKMKKERKFS